MIDDFKTYLRWSSADQAALEELCPQLEDQFQGIVDSFYENILTSQDMSATLTEGPGQVDRLKKSLASWLKGLFLKERDSAYEEMLFHVGRVHVRIGLDQHFMITMMNHIGDRLTRACLTRQGLDQDAHVRDLEAVHKALSLDLALMLHTYAEGRQQKSLKVYQDLIEGSSDLVCIINKNGKFVYLNQGCGGRSQQELFTGGQSLLESLMDEPSLQAFQEAAHKVLEEAEPVNNLPCKAGGPDGVREILWDLLPLRREDGSTWAMQGIARDVTVFRSAERERQMVLDRLNQQEKLASLGRMAASVAHEVKNPLAALSSVVQSMVEDLPEDAPRRKLASTVLQRVDGLTRYIQDILEFSRDKDLTLSDSDPEFIVRESLALFHRDPRFSKIKTQVDVGPGASSHLRCDALRIQRVMTNLLINAGEAASGQGQVTVKMEGDGKGLWIKVIDQGPGIPVKLRERIFEAFYTSKDQGSGLGLALARQIARAHGGELEFKPGSHSGSEFHLFLPIQPSGAENPQ